jgi:glycolate oxidase FAD binding subunit
MIAGASVDVAGLDVAVGEPARASLGAQEPAYAFTPRTPEALAALLARCDAAGAACVTLGGGTLQGMGNAPARFDVAIRTDALAGVLAYDPRDLTVSVAAGTTLRAFADRLAANGQFVPLDAPHVATGTVGGALATGWIGPRRSTYGRARDLVIGTTVALVDGTLAHAGGMVVKNVSGYDASKLYIGSLGTLGVLASANFKCLPLPAARRAIVARLANDNRVRAVDHIARLDIEPTAALVVAGFDETQLDRDYESLFLLFEGSAAVVDRATRETRSALGAAGVASARVIDDPQPLFQRVLDAYVAVRASGSLTVRSTGLPTTVDERRFAATLRARDHGCTCETIADLLTGDLITRFARAHDLPETAAELVAAMRAEMPTTTVIAGTPASRGAVDAWPAPPSAYGHMRDLKLQFDPRGTLAPGRFVGGI